MKEVNTQDLFQDLEYLTNTNDHELTDLAVKLTGMHRTLQQSFMRNFILPWCREQVDRGDNGWYDARNEATYRICKEIMKIAENGHYLPMI